MYNFVLKGDFTRFSTGAHQCAISPSPMPCIQKQAGLLASGVDKFNTQLATLSIPAGATTQAAHLQIAGLTLATDIHTLSTAPNTSVYQLTAVKLGTDSQQFDAAYQDLQMALLNRAYS